jgi:hypothetical protein
MLCCGVGKEGVANGKGIERCFILRTGKLFAPKCGSYIYTVLNRLCDLGVGLFHGGGGGGGGKNSTEPSASNVILRTPQIYLNACGLVSMALLLPRLPALLILLLPLHIFPASCIPDPHALIAWADSIGLDSSNITLQSPTIFEGWGVRASRRIRKGEIFM